MGWLKYVDRLPSAMETISKYPDLYRNFKTPESNENTEFIWMSVIRNNMGIPKLQKIWEAFRNVFWLYLVQLEKGIQNKWAVNWWRVLYQLKFLVVERYKSNDPFHYIAHNKIEEEAGFCKIAEIKSQIRTDENGEIIHPSDHRRLAKAIRSYSSWIEVAEALNLPVEVCRKRFRLLLREYLLYISADKNNGCLFNKSYFFHIHKIYQDIDTKTSLSGTETLFDMLSKPRESKEEHDPFISSESDKDTENILEQIVKEIDEFSPKLKKKLETGFDNLLKKYKKFEVKIEGNN